VGFKWKNGHTPLVLDFVKGREWLCNTKSEHCRNNTASKNAPRETVQERNFPVLNVEDVKLKTKAISIRCVAELARVF